MTETQPVPILPASTLVLIRDCPDLHVYLMRRNARSVFVGDMWMFPGGGLEDQDRVPHLAALSPDLSEAEANQRLGLAEGGLAWWVAALRETFEEAGVLLARPRDGRPALKIRGDVERERVDAQRARLESGRLEFARMLEDEKLELELAAMPYIARWITPPNSPRRYDTRFFLAVMPEGQIARHDNREAVHSEWLRPAEAISRWERGEIEMLPPTRAALQVLAEYSSSARALSDAQAQQSGSDLEVRREGNDLRAPLFLPGDADYENEAISGLDGWVRFVARPS
ncbi:NUDIX domain-containing protein [Myxococcota bacterium]|nr:NUDIX domain-containing protein [Myxococcota bacterium]